MTVLWHLNCQRAAQEITAAEHDAFKGIFLRSAENDARLVLGTDEQDTVLDHFGQLNAEFCKVIGRTDWLAPLNARQERNGMTFADLVATGARNCNSVHRREKFFRRLAFLLRFLPARLAALLRRT